MTARVIAAPFDPNPPPARRRRHRVVLVALVVVVTVVAVLVALAIREFSRGVPDFPLLARNPDGSLQGTVAYYDPNGCVRIIAAAGSPSKEVLCLPQGQDVKTAEKLGKQIGPQLVWRTDGRLEITMFRMPPGQKGRLRGRMAAARGRPHRRGH